jgi:hypothetical protein
VPADDLSREFDDVRDPVEVCARTVRAMLDAGVRHFYVSNLPLGRVRETLDAIVERAGT